MGTTFVNQIVTQGDACAPVRTSTSSSIFFSPTENIAKGSNHNLQAM